MASEQTLVFTLKSYSKINLIPHSLLNPKPSVHLFSAAKEPKKKKRLGFGAGIKCSNDYSFGSSIDGQTQTERVVEQQYPRPTEIQWKKELCNSVKLIGILAWPVKIKHLDSGKVLAWSRLTVKKSLTETFSVRLTFWDELALVASQHLEKGQQLFISGKLVADTVESGDGKLESYYRVVVQELNFIERQLSSDSLDERDSNSMGPVKKNNYRAPNTISLEKLWQAFFANPTEWWDNRKNKTNPRSPDFKHKDTGEALWIEGRFNPPWVKSQLAVLDSKMEAFHDQNSKMHKSFIEGDGFSQF